LKQR